jgi:hypothetical protein
VLDPQRRSHVYLFEHHADRNLRSFLRTVVGTLRPIRFWSVLHPTQPSNTRRLLMYMLIGQGLYLLAVVGYYMWTAHEEARANRAKPSPTPAMVAASLSRLSPGQLQVRITPFRTVQDYISFVCRPPTTLGVLQQRLHKNYRWVIVQDGMWAVLVPLMWPWATYVALRLFRRSMSRARIHRAHVLRCMVYSFDLAIWAAALLFVGSICGILSGPSDSIERLVNRSLTLLWMLGGLYCMVRLYVACRLYLKVKSPFAVVGLSQIIVGLVAVNILVLVRLS